jgi:hypothetical protein
LEVSTRLLPFLPVIAFENIPSPLFHGTSSPIIASTRPATFRKNVLEKDITLDYTKNNL